MHGVSVHICRSGHAGIPPLNLLAGQYQASACGGQSQNMAVAAAIGRLIALSMELHQCPQHPPFLSHIVLLGKRRKSTAFPGDRPHQSGCEGAYFMTELTEKRIRIFPYARVKDSSDALPWP